MGLVKQFSSSMIQFGTMSTLPQHVATHTSPCLAIDSHVCLGTGLMKESKIGQGNVESGAVNVNERRTSSTLLLEPAVVQQHQALQPMVLQLQAKAQQLLDVGECTASTTALGDRDCAARPALQFQTSSMMVAFGQSCGFRRKHRSY